MSTILTLFDEYNDKNNISTVNSIKPSEFNINNISKNFVISQDKEGNILSTYNDDIWDLKPYRSNPSQHAVLDFDLRIKNKENIRTSKQLIFLLLLFTSGRNGSKLSVETTQHYFRDFIVPLSDYSLSIGISIPDILASSKHIINYIKQPTFVKRQLKSLTSFLVFLDSMDNEITLIDFKRDKKVFDLLGKLRKQFHNQVVQTAHIPSRIFSESLRQRWEQIDYIEKNIENILLFLDNCIGSQYFALNLSTSKQIPVKSRKNVILWSEAVSKYNLNDLFDKYKITDRSLFVSFFTKLQGTCNHLIHAYTGMRRGEVLSLKTNCLNTVSSLSGICHIISTTSKLEGTNKTVKWVTSKELKRVIDLLSKINNIVAKHYNFDLDKLPLFLKGVLFGKKDHTKLIDDLSKAKFDLKDKLPMDDSNLIFTQEDKNELDEINFNSKMENLDLGKPWVFKTHQYRRSLAVYSIQSGLVSLGALQIQLKHLFKEMTMYYGNGASYAKKLFDVPKEHIANDIDLLKPELDTLAYIKNVIFSDEQLFGTHGTFIERNIKTKEESQKLYLLENREKTIKQFKNGEIAYKETAIGGCISTESCDYLLTRSIVACSGCDSSIVKKSKLDNIIKEQKEFIEFLDKDSVEYRTEIADLRELEKQRKILLGSKA